MFHLFRFAVHPRLSLRACVESSRGILGQLDLRVVRSGAQVLLDGGVYQPAAQGREDGDGQEEGQGSAQECQSHTACLHVVVEGGKRIRPRWAATGRP